MKTKSLSCCVVNGGGDATTCSMCVCMHTIVCACISQLHVHVYLACIFKKIKTYRVYGIDMCT